MHVRCLVGFGEVVGNLALLVLLDVEEHGAVLCERARGKERVRRWKDEVLAGGGIRNLDEAGARRAQMLVVAAQQLQAQQLVISRHEPLNLVEDRKRIKRRKLRLEVVAGEPDSGTVGLSGLPA